MTADGRRLAYLEALGIDVFALRETQAPAREAVSACGRQTQYPDSPPAEPPDWSSLRRAVASCTRCPLHAGRTQTVFGVGNPEADWMIIGEAPGAEEDRRGEPFVGRAGKLLDEMLRAVDLSRDSVFIANILKCRPPGNRDPAAAEAEACRGHLERQIELVSPKLILAVGRIAAQQLLHVDTPLGRLRGRVHILNKPGEPDGRLRGRVHILNKPEIPVIVTYHPAYLLRTPSQKREAWKDLRLACRLIRDRVA